MNKLAIILFAAIVAVSCLKQEDYHIDITYTGAQLRYIGCPLGGIGTGNILLNGYGAIQDFEIFNKPAMNGDPPNMTFFSLYAKSMGHDPVVRVLEGEFLDEYPDPFGIPRQRLGGLPRFREATFHNAYPMVHIDLLDEAVPLEVSQSAWSPFIPGDTKNSSIPAAVVEWNLANSGEETVAFSLAFAMENPMRRTASEGKKTTEDGTITPYRSGQWKGFTFGSPGADSLQPGAGYFRVLFPGESKLAIPLGSYNQREGASVFWDDFSEDGILQMPSDTFLLDGPNTAAAMFFSGELAPGESITLPFLFAWHVPYRMSEENMIDVNDPSSGTLSRNYYTTLYKDINEVTDQLTAGLAGLKDKTLRFSEAMITSSVPPAVLDAAISNMAALKTNLLAQHESGHLHVYDGLGDDFARGPGNGTDVWNYSQTMAMLFPSLERDIRETGFNHSTCENGYQCAGTVFPLSENCSTHAVADGQMGNIMRVYREWKMSGNDQWLGWVWPNVKKALEFAWKGVGEIHDAHPWMSSFHHPWDPNKEGVMRGGQLNTYGIILFGPNMLTGSLYLGALKACSEMALVMNEPQKSVEYGELFLKGRDRYMDLLWNGEYFTQQVDVIEGVTIPDRLKSPPDASGHVLPKYQVGDGCLSDQLLGQYLAFVSGMGYIMDTATTQEALASVYRYNFREQMRDVENVQRVFAANGEPGLVNCSWPVGSKPDNAFPFAGEVWTGIEYQVATSLIFADLVDEGLKITEGVRSRYNGTNRNPFAEIESGRYCARAMSSWGVYQAMAGYQYDATKDRMKFSPAEDVLPVRFFWSAAKGWGTLEVSRAKIQLACMHGTLDLDELVLEGRSFFVLREFVPTHEVDVSYNHNALTIGFNGGLSLQEGEEFRMDLP